MTANESLADRLAKKLAATEARLTNASHNHMAVMRILECAEISVDDRMQVEFVRNAEQIFPNAAIPCAVVDLFDDTTEAERYFDWIFDVREIMRAKAKAAEGMPWDQVFPNPRRKDDSLLRWKPFPQGDWQITADEAISSTASNAIGQYLMSPKQLIAADQDFRLEYTAQAGATPCDLSATVGGPLYDGSFALSLPLPEDRGYCFGFGSLGNSITQLQRYRRQTAVSDRVILPHQEYHCVAERVGGRLRFYIDGQIAYEYIDILPLLGDGHGHVGLYTWGAGQRFSEVKLFSRPTCLTQEQRQAIAHNRAPMLKVRGDGSRYVEVRLIGSRIGPGRTVYQLLVRDSSVAVQEIQKRMVAEQAGSFEAERLAVTLRSIGDGIITTDTLSRVTLMNRAAEVLTGWSQEEAIGKPLTKVFHILKDSGEFLPEPAVTPANLADKASVIIGRDDYITMIARDSTRRIIAKSGAPIQDRTGRVIGTVLVFRDITAQHKAEEARAQLAAIVESSEDAIIGKSLDGRIVTWNAGAERLLGYAAAEVIGRSGDFLHAPGAPVDALEATQRVATGLLSEHYETVYVTHEGKHLQVALTKSVIKDAAGRLIGVSTIARDITARKRTEAALRESEERYALAARGASDGLWDWNLKTGEIYYSPRFRDMLGLNDSELGRRLEDWLQRVHSEDIETMRAKIADHRAGRTPHFEAEHRLRHQNGEYRWMLARGLAVFDLQHHATRMAGSLTDITDRKIAENQFRHDALHDRLTELPNRALFADRLNHALQRLKRTPDYHFAAMFLDLDGFKPVNDRRGHQVGDKLLMEVARRLTAIVRPVDTVGRQGGDEFTLLLDGVKDLESAVIIADRVLKDFAAPFVIDDEPITISVSIGIAMSSTSYENGDEVLRDADLAMYRAKAFGKARYEVFKQPLPGPVETPVP